MDQATVDAITAVANYAPLTAGISTIAVAIGGVILTIVGVKMLLGFLKGH